MGIYALLVLDNEGQRLAVKYSSYARKELWAGGKAQLAFEKRVISKLPKPCAARSEVDVAVIDEYTVLFQACNDIVVCAVAGGNENELVVMQLLEGIFTSMSSTAQGSSFLSTGLTKQLVLDSLSDVLFILDEAIDDAIIMETGEEVLTSRVKMIDEIEASNAGQAEAMFQKATQSAKTKLLGSLLG